MISRKSTRAWQFLRSGRGMPEPSAVVSRAQTFAAASRDFSHVTLLSVGTSSGVSGFLITPDRADADPAALNLAHAVSARAEPVADLPDLSGTRKVGVVLADTRAAVGRATQSGADPAETSRRIALAMGNSIDPEESPSWLAATVRLPSRSERKRTLRWYAARLGSFGTHHVLDNQSVVASFSSGGQDAGEVKQRLHQVIAALPGFDIAVKVRILRPWISGVWALLVGAAAGVGLHLLHHPLWQQIIAGVAGVLIFAAIAAGVIPTKDSAAIARARRGVFDKPARKFGLTSKPPKKTDPDADNPRRSAGDYPLARDVFLLGPALLTGLVAPHAGAASGSAVTERRSASAAMLDAHIGPLFGTAGATESGTAADLEIADDQLAKVYSSTVTESARRSQTQAARNKIGEMLAAESWWSPMRKKITWRQVLTGHKSVVINTGVSAHGHQIDERLGKYLTSLLTYSMVETIKRLCSGWQDEQRYISVFSDELSLMAGSSEQTLTWLHDQGRSYGIRPFLATQRLQQLPAPLRDSLGDYSAIAWFAQSSNDAATTAVSDLSADGSEWTNSDITGLEPFTAVVRSYVGKIRQPAVPVKISYFEKDMASFAAAQGYPPAPTR